MSDTIPQWFIRQYESDVHKVFQREGGYLRNTVRMKTGIVGKSTNFPVIGKGTATTKSRHGVTTPMNLDHSSVQCLIEDFYAPEYVDKLDESKINADERASIATSGAWAIGRKVDEQITTALDATSEATVTLTVTSQAAILASLITFAEAAWENDVPNDGYVFGLLTPRMWSQAMTVEQFSSADYVDGMGRPFNVGAATNGKFVNWMGIKWMMHTGLPGKGTATAKCFLYHKNAIGYAAGAHERNGAESDSISADIWWDGSRQAHLITHCMSGGAVIIDSTGVIEGNLDDTAAVATS